MLLLLALGILCGLAAAVFATLETRPVRAAAALLAAALLTFGLLGLSRVPDPAWIGVGIGTCALIALFKPRWSVVAVLGGGAAAAIWVNLLVATGIGVTFAVAAAVLAPGASVILGAKRTDFAPRALREEALVIVTILALVVAAAPSISAGFSAALALKTQPLSSETTTSGLWLLMLTGGCLLTGGVYSIWKRR